MHSSDAFKILLHDERLVHYCQLTGLFFCYTLLNITKVVVSWKLQKSSLLAKFLIYFCQAKKICILLCALVFNKKLIIVVLYIMESKVYYRVAYAATV